MLVYATAAAAGKEIGGKWRNAPLLEDFHGWSHTKKNEKAGLFTSIRLLIHLQKMTTMSRLYQLLHLKFVKKKDAH